MITKMLISTGKIGQVMAVIDKINRKAERWGFAPFRFQVTGEAQLREVDLGPPYGVMMVSGVPVEIEGDGFKFGNYALRGQVRYDGDGSLKSMREHGDFKLPAAEIMNRNLCCEHCQTTRDRNHYFYVQDLSDPKQPVKRIGSTCVEDVLGYSPATVASFAQLVHDAIAMIETMEADGDVLASMRDSDGVNQDASAGTAVTDALALGLDVIKTHGYISQTRCVEMLQGGVGVESTAARLYKAIASKTTPVPENVQLAQEFVARERQRFDHLCATGGSFPAFDAKVMAMLLSSTLTAERLPLVGYCAQGMLREQRLARATTNSLPLGTVGEVLEGDFQVRFRHSFDTKFGLKYLVTMADQNDNQVAWFTTSPQGLKVDDMVRLSGKVDKHEDYKGVMQTVISRPSLHAVLGRDDYEGEWPCASEWERGLSRELLKEAGNLNLAAVKRLQAMGADIDHVQEETPGVMAGALDAAMVTLCRGGCSLGEQPKSVQSLVKHLIKAGCRLNAEWEDEELISFGFGQIGIKLDSVRASVVVKPANENDTAPSL